MRAMRFVLALLISGVCAKTGIQPGEWFVSAGFPSLKAGQEARFTIPEDHALKQKDGDGHALHKGRLRLTGAINSFDEVHFFVDKKGKMSFEPPKNAQKHLGQAGVSIRGGQFKDQQTLDLLIDLPIVGQNRLTLKQK